MCDKASGAKTFCRLAFGLAAAATLGLGAASAAPAKSAPPPAKAPVAKPLPAPPATPAPAPAASPAVTDDEAPLSSRPSSAGPETCRDCHAAFDRKKYKHAALAKTDCLDCHKATKRVGRCKSATASAWTLVKNEAELCAKCHKEDQIAAKYTVRHEFGGRCAPCHDAHASEQPRLLRGSGRAMCLGCHDSRSNIKVARNRIDLAKKVVHKSAEGDCQACHEQGHGGKARNFLKKGQPELCYDCHKRKDKLPVVHTAIRQGECLECHDAHSSNWKGLTKKPREQVCLACHEVEPLAPKEVKHAPVAEGRCLDCHDAHGGDRPNFAKGTGKQQCLTCHDASAPKGKGEAGDHMRVDLSKKVVHAAVKKGECTDCHEAGHSGDMPRLLKKQPLALCYDCHQRKDDHKFVHSAVTVGDCQVCHDPHSSDRPKLVAKEKDPQVCFTCHHDDVTGRDFIHAPVAQGKCLDCHGPHGAPNRFVLTIGSGKQACYTCHEPIDRGKVKHAALERYGCTGCHDPHGAGNKFLLGKKTNALCVSCHPNNKDGVHVTNITAKGHIVSGPIDPRRAGKEFTCATCHNPHGSDNAKLFYFGSTPMESCDGCHGDKSGKRPELKNVVSKVKQLREAGSAGAGSGGAGGGAGGGSGGGGGGGFGPLPPPGSSLKPAARVKYGLSADKAAAAPVPAVAPAPQQTEKK